jgi:hypothetical protein
MAKRRYHKTGGYSREFTPRGKGRSYALTGIPAGFWESVQAKARAEQVSVRALILGKLKTWLDEPSSRAE